MTSPHAQRGFGLGMHGSFFEMYGMPIIIVVVLALIAVPAYREYRTKQRIAEAIAGAAGLRAAIERAFAARGPGDMSVAAPPVAPAGEDVASIRVAKSGVISIEFAAQVLETGANRVALVPTANGTRLDLSAAASKGRSFAWTCAGKSGGTTVEAKWLPEDCR